mmetsp:Transcript_30970/g.63810  ORF Transcript_30970/g.63810 Transcript_30970/m.63810 type:complete len:275 (+) Transcript_30970:30-854(+)
MTTMTSFLKFLALISTFTTTNGERPIFFRNKAFSAAFNAAPLTLSWGRDYDHNRAIKTRPNRGISTSASSLASSSSFRSPPLGKQICTYKTVTIRPSGMNAGDAPRQAVSVEDLTPEIKSFLSQSGMKQGVIHVISRHTTTAITINERESRLARDIEEFFLKICPPDERSSTPKKVSGVRYLHNDIDQRPDGEEEAERCRENGWNIDDADELQKWRDQEPINAHSHLISMMLGSSECIPVVDGEMVIGQWQSVLLVDLDGPRTRSVGLQMMGFG